MLWNAPTPVAASTAVWTTLTGPTRDAVVVASGPVAAYLMLDDSSDVVALVTPQAVRLPIALLVEELPDLRAGDRARVGRREVCVGCSRWRAVRWWNPRPRVAVSALLSAAPVFGAFVLELATTSYGVDTAAALDAGIRLSAGDATAACGLLGSGPGFTPAGDDVVAGALAVLSLTELLDPEARDCVLRAAHDRTTSLSSALLAAAARGEVIPQVAHLITAVTSDAPPDAVRARLSDVLAVGATSGAALVLGMAAALAAQAAEMETT